MEYNKLKWQSEKVEKAEKVEKLEQENQKNLHNQDLIELDYNSQLVEFIDS
jgi:hypothetical protein